MIRLKKYSIKSPSGIRAVTALAMLSVIQIPNVIDILYEKTSLMRISISIVGFLILLTALILTLNRAFRKPTEMQLFNDTILINGRTVQAKDISAVMKMGYFRPVIGLKPYGKRIVPLHMCFRFTEDEDKCIKDIGLWAEENNVKVVNKTFMRWV